MDRKHKSCADQTVSVIEPVFQSFSFGRPPAISFEYIDSLAPRDPDKTVDANSGNDISCMYLLYFHSF
jgi:hypothetical protein